jgi:hypothetical protein
MQAIDLQHPAPVITTATPVIHDTRAPLQTTGKTTLWARIAITVRAKGYSFSTERTYVHWAKRFVAWHGKRHPATMIYTHVVNRGGRGTVSPLDRMAN